MAHKSTTTFVEDKLGRTTSYGWAAHTIIPQLDHFMQADPTHQQSYQTSKVRIEQGTPQDILGNRHFWRSDYTAHHRAGYLTSVRMCSSRTVGMEMDVNTENLYGYYLPFGLTYIYRTGGEYEEIFPIWDWARLPGVTSPHEEIRMKGKVGQKTNFVGGVSDGHYGISVMDLDLEHTQAQKAWFWFDDEWVALGTGIRSTHQAPIVTGVNQTLLRGDVLLNDQKFYGVREQLKGTNWVWHDSVAYFFPGKQLLHIQAIEQHGQLQKIYGLGADSIYRSDVFSLWLDHGLQPKHASYAYMVLPACSTVPKEQLESGPPIDIPINTPAMQMVNHQKLGLSGIVFYEAGVATLPDGRQIEVDHPCLVLLDLPNKQLTISDPTTNLKEIELITYRSRPAEGENDHFTNT